MINDASSGENVTAFGSHYPVQMSVDITPAGDLEPKDVPWTTKGRVPLRARDKRLGNGVNVAGQDDGLKPPLITADNLRKDYHLERRYGKKNPKKLQGKSLHVLHQARKMKTGRTGMLFYTYGSHRST